MHFSLRKLYFLLFLLAVPAFLLNLDLLAFIDDEAIRSIVAFEMWKTGDYFVPTINGELYLNKPPLYNWILVLSMALAGQANEWTARIPTLVFLALFCYTIYRYCRGHMEQRLAVLIALAYLTCGRILLWDSFLGLIDICFSWVMYLLFIATFHFTQQKKWRELWLSVYALTVIGFMLKGLPALVFLVFTLSAYLIYQGEWRRLFNKWHFAGIGLFALLVGSYYAIYASRTGGLSFILERLFDESSKRTVVQFGIVQTIKHIFTFPFEMVYHFLPWSVFSLILFQKGIRARIRQHPFIAFNLLVFLVNIPIYWTSPQVYPRYLLMLAPVYFTVVLYLWWQGAAQKSWQNRLLQGVIWFFAIGLLLGAAVPLFYPGLGQYVEHVPLKAALLVLGMLALFYGFCRQARYRPEWLIAMFLLGRIGFDCFVQPERAYRGIGNLSRKEARAAGERFKGQQLAIAGERSREIMGTFYFSVGYDQPLRVEKGPLQAGRLYIADSSFVQQQRVELLDSFHVRYEKAQRYVLRAID